ncbi:RNA polymerase subunit sigma-70 [Nocardioides sp. Soil797]|nr:RNA polymerase subunit sigma-70 [Nocardioides sp. Soil797]
MDETEGFEQERPRLIRIATQVLGDHAEAEDVVQQAWLRLHRNETAIENLPGWLTTVTTRLCLDRLKAKTPSPVEDEALEVATTPDPAVDVVLDDIVLADTVGVALQVVLDRLSPRERVAFVLHDSFGFDFPTVAAVLETTPAAARKLASRARARIGQPATEDSLADWEVVDAFMSAAREGNFARLLELLAPDATIRADAAAIRSGTPERMDGRDELAGFFNGSAHAALPVFVGERPGSAWFHKGQAMVVFDFTITDGVIEGITFRAEPETLASVVRREGEARRN